MTARTISQRRTFAPHRESWPHYLWRLILEAIALIVAWLVVVSAAAAQQPGNPLNQFDPDKFLQQLFGAAGGNLNDDGRLAKVEIPWDEEQRMGQQGYEELKQQLAAKRAGLVERGREVEYLQRLA